MESLINTVPGPGIASLLALGVFRPCEESTQVCGLVVVDGLGR